MSHPLDDLMDSWMEMMDVMQRPRRTIRPTERPTSIGDWEDRNGDISVTLDMPGIEKKDIELNDLFEQRNKDNIEEKSVLILGSAGVGKSTLM